MKALYAESKLAEAQKDWERCLRILTNCSRLLPPETLQYRQIQDEIRKICHYYNTQAPALNPESLEAPDQEELRQKSFPAVILSTFFRILKGLTKPKTLVSMVLWIVCFSILLGWREAAVFAFMIYIHEMGNLLAIQYYGYRFAWPMFIPFLGAFVLQGKQSDDPLERMMIAVAGPLAGSLLSIAILCVKYFFRIPLFILHMAFLNLLINFFNLMPVWILDGSRIAKELGKRHLILLMIGLSIFTILDRNSFSLILAVAWGISIFVMGNKNHEFFMKQEDKSRISYGFVALLFLLLIVSGFFLKRTRPSLL